MNDLISRKELLESIEKVSVKGNVLDDDWVYRFVQEFPSVDAVPVIRCKDCIHSTSQVSDDEDDYYCNVMMRCMHSLEYCSNGERKES